MDYYKLMHIFEICSGHQEMAVKEHLAQPSNEMVGVPGEAKEDFMNCYLSGVITDA